MLSPGVQISQEVKWVSAMYKKLLDLNDKGMKLFNEKIQPLFKDAKLLELIQLNQEYQKLNADLQGVIALKDLSEDLLYECYKPALIFAGTKEHLDFSKENLEAFYRLKFRSIEERIA